MTGKLKEHPKVLALLFVSAVVLCAGLAYTYWPMGLPAMPETMEDVPGLLESRAYANLSPKQRRPYVQRVSELMRSSDQKRRQAVMKKSEMLGAAAKDLYMQMLVERARQYALADEATKRQILQEDRAKMKDKRRGRPGQKDDDGKNLGKPELAKDEKAQLREKHERMFEEWVNEGNGQEEALIREYLQQLGPKE